MITTTKTCTHCGEQKGTTDDHVFPKCLFVERSNDRSILVPSCESCNCKSEEGLLKSFFALFDGRIARTRLGQELLHRQGKGDLRSFVAICNHETGFAYPEERVTRLLKKLFQGLRRHILKDQWLFLSADDLTVFTVRKHGPRQFLRQLPLTINGPNQAFPIPPAFEVGDKFEQSFRDFRFGLDEGVIKLRYTRTFHGNELVLCALSVQQNEGVQSGMT